ncbi:nitrogenase-stabilizing/protective protein NifW [Uliginosibacterium sp. 31-16]|uniref:nitrogenase-stabilizing/protective protein NifW n=1 Tax=Uliginosibacterium sp. 31-16 TaxID=3068315 RepID=UPI00273D008B|nr:nitrogenase-stabilizing/protective protein NifW [Uliginosibacterium sp. 31-16]MDP5241341.1 nitrogenase-stabilizing/protective protein NifW [Uliginosibacterium sp. 31-16]
MTTKTLSPEDFAAELAELESIEDFLAYFCIEYDPAVVQINRLHILQRFHDYLRGAGKEPEFETWKRLLARAYEDFVRSDALTEGVFSVFKRARGIATIPLSAIGRARS